MEGVVVSAFYKFVSMDNARLEAARKALEDFAREQGLRGLIVMGLEGVNGTVSAPATVMEGFKALLSATFPEEPFDFKDSRAPEIPFGRFKVDVRPEIITTRDLSISSEESKGTHLTPRQWHDMIESDPDVVLVDTRNDYEVEIGTFQGAIDPFIKKFSDFQGFLEKGDLPKDKKLLMFCTGGIRCEKAVPEVKRLGYDNVYQLEGGILRYLEEFPEGHFEGECFVFDKRIAVDARLRPSEVYSQCPHCGNPGKEKISCENCETETVVCHRCVSIPERNSCSKNCAYHLRRGLAKRA